MPVDSVLEKNICCSLNGTDHLSFDFTQQVHFPYDPLQPGYISRQPQNASYSE